MDECGNYISLAQIIVRAILLFVVSIGGMISIFLGWQLYRDSIISKTSGSLETSGIKLRVTTASPGIVLAGFGAYLLSTVALHKFETETVVSSQAITPPSSQNFTPTLPKRFVAPSSMGRMNEKEWGQDVTSVQMPAKVQMDDDYFIKVASENSSPSNQRFSCFLYRKKTSWLSGESVTPPEKLKTEIDNVIGIVSKFNPSTKEEITSKRSALKTLTEISSVMSDTIEEGKNGTDQ